MSRAVPLILLALAILACTRGNECDRCSRDGDCREGFVCSAFDDGSRRCGTGVIGRESSCRVQ